MMQWVRKVLWAIVLGATTSLCAQAGVLDAVFARKDDLGPPSQREWRLDEFTRIRLVPQEAGAPANQHPASIDPIALRQQLSAFSVPQGLTARAMP